MLLNLSDIIFVCASGFAASMDKCLQVTNNKQDQVYLFISYFPCLLFVGLMGYPKTTEPSLLATMSQVVHSGLFLFESGLCSMQVTMVSPFYNTFNNRGNMLQWLARTGSIQHLFKNFTFVLLTLHSCRTDLNYSLCVWLHLVPYSETALSNMKSCYKK